MKIKALSRSLDAHAPSSSGAPAPQSRNLDPSQHPFAQAREYTRALNAVKVERMFSKPFVGALEGHSDGVYVVEMDAARGNIVATGAGDGEIRLWHLPTRSLLQSIPKAHNSIVQSLCLSPLSFSAASSSGLGSRRLLSCGTDRTIQMWDANPDSGRIEAPDDDGDDEDGTAGWLKDRKVERTDPLLTWHSKTAFNSLSHHASSPIFASASNVIQLWDLSRGQSSSSSSSSSAALQTLRWDSSSSADTINVVRFNQSEPELIVGCGSDRGVNLYDTRTGGAVTGIKMNMRSNDVAWNPIEPSVFTLASEDQNLYTFDIRNLKTSTQIYKDHVSAVMSVAYSPTGQDLVSGSYDRTIRLWSVGKGNRSRDVYHTSRMQRVFSTAWTMDARFVLSGSDDGNVRLWKSQASDKLGVLSTKELKAAEYREALKKKWGGTSTTASGAGVGEITRIAKQRRVPKAIKGAQQLKRTMLEAQRVKGERRRKHTKEGQHKPKSARKQAIIGEKS